MNAQRAAQAYLAVEVESSAPLHRLVLLHERAVRALREGVRHVERREVEEAHADFVKAEQIILHFLTSIPEDDDGEVAVHLRGLFIYCFRQTAEANLRKDTRCADAALRVLVPLAEGWAELDAQRRPSARPEVSGQKSDLMPPLP